MNDHPTDLLLQILTADTKEPAARLKQKLNAKLIDKGMGPFDQNALGFKTFKEYLLSLGDRVSIEERAGSDILVSLGQAATATPAASKAVRPTTLRKDVWLAFTNPDPQRLRFYDKETRAIEHKTAAEYAQTGLPGPSRIPVPLVDAPRQSEWMKEFLRLHDLQSDKLLEKIAAEPYSSAANATFCTALGKKGVAWRRFRADKVIEEVHAWAVQHEISLADLQEPPESPAPGASGQSLSPRSRAVRLLDSFSDQELVDLVIPLLAASALVKSRT